jgi:hypothetical protein
MSNRTATKFLVGFLPCLLAGVTQAANAIDEVEPNDPISAAQALFISGEVAVSAELGNNGSDDVDYYTFSATAGDVVTIDIDNGWGDAKPVDTKIAIFDGGADHKILDSNDDAHKVDPGSTSTLDSRIENWVVPTTGSYIVGVTNFRRSFADGGSVTGTPGQGDYTLVISGVTNSIKQVALEVKPGKREIAPVNPKSHGKIPVAILGGPDFNALNVDPKTLTFGATGEESSLAKCNPVGTDVNRDGRVDLICHFNTQAAHLDPTEEHAKIHGFTKDGTEFEGTGYLKVVPMKRL